jgi:hypothetical protein
MIQAHSQARLKWDAQGRASLPGEWQRLMQWMIQAHSQARLREITDGSHFPPAALAFGFFARGGDAAAG